MTYPLCMFSWIRKDLELCFSLQTLYLTERAKNISPGDVSLKIKRAETLIKLGRFIEAQEQCT